MAPKATFVPLLDQTPFAASSPPRAVAAATSPELIRPDGVMSYAVGQRLDANLQPPAEIDRGEGPATGIDQQTHLPHEDSSRSHSASSHNVSHGVSRNASTVTLRSHSSQRKRSSRAKGKSSAVTSHQHPIWCRLCDETFSEDKEFKRHFSLHAPAYLCPFRRYGCNFVFKRTDPLRNHLKNHHGIGRGARNDHNYDKVERRHAIGCVLCVRVFSRVLDYVNHHVEHCRAGLVKADTDEILEIESLFIQRGLLERWIQSVRRSGFSIRAFIQWCLQQSADLRERLEGERLVDGVPEHVRKVRALLERLLHGYNEFVEEPTSTADHRSQDAYAASRITGERFRVQFRGVEQHIQPIDNAPWTSSTVLVGTNSGLADPERNRVRNCLINTVHDGLRPTFTRHTGLLCGIYALVGSMNEALPWEEHLRAEDVIQVIWQDNGRPSPSYRAFLQNHLRRLLGPAPAHEVYNMAWEELATPNNLSAQQLQLLPTFLRRQGMLRRDLAVGMVIEGGRTWDGRVVEPGVVVEDTRPEAFVIWLHNDNAQLLLGSELNHWSMFSRAPGRVHGALSSIGLEGLVATNQSVLQQNAAALDSHDWLQSPASIEVRSLNRSNSTVGEHYDSPVAMASASDSVYWYQPTEVADDCQPAATMFARGERFGPSSDNPAISLAGADRIDLEAITSEATEYLHFGQPCSRMTSKLTNADFATVDAGNTPDTPRTWEDFWHLLDE
ncbi:hypothetical protein LTR86_005902 [Recurvomyces mirabilis]|nr:hypothetical protein LTR86_005902 [Recurvomyces mirabilis]